jgi:hypothetical protein
MKRSKTYKEEALKIAKAFDIAIEAYSKYPPKDFEKDYISFLDGWMKACLSPNTPFRKRISDLKFLHPILFEFFQETKGKTVEYFWKRIQEEKLDYKRRKKTLINEILERGKIKDRNEYNYVVDMIGTLKQEGITTKEDTIELDKMIGKYRD